MENLEKKRIRFEFMVDDKWKWYAQDKDGTITLFVDKPNLVDDTWDVNGEYKTLTFPGSGAIVIGGWETSLSPMSHASA